MIIVTLVTYFRLKLRPLLAACANSPLEPQAVPRSRRPCHAACTGLGCLVPPLLFSEGRGSGRWWSRHYRRLNTDTLSDSEQAMMQGEESSTFGSFGISSVTRGRFYQQDTR